MSRYIHAWADFTTEDIRLKMPMFDPDLLRGIDAIAPAEEAAAPNAVEPHVHWIPDEDQDALMGEDDDYAFIDVDTGRDESEDESEDDGIYDDDDEISEPDIREDDDEDDDDPMEADDEDEEAEPGIQLRNPRLSRELQRLHTATNTAEPITAPDATGMHTRARAAAMVEPDEIVMRLECIHRIFAFAVTGVIGITSPIY